MAYRDRNGRLHGDNGKFIKDTAIAKTVQTPEPSKNYSVRNDFMDYESKGVTAYHFGDTRPQFTMLSNKNYGLLDNWYHKNGIANAIVNKPAQDAVRNGWQLVIEDNPDLQEAYQDAMNKLNLKREIANELRYRYLHGDGYLHWGIQELYGTNLYTPINQYNVENVVFVHAFGQKYVDQVIVNNDPTDPNYGKEQTIVMRPTSTGQTIRPDGTPIPNPPKTKPTLIDASRYAHTSNDRLEDDTTGNSVLTLNADPIKVLDTALYSAGKILYEYSQKIMHSDHLAREDPEKYQRDMHVLSQGFTTESVVTMGTDETLEKVSTNVGAVQQLFDLAWQVLNTGTQIPKSVLLGEQAGTLAGATQDVANYYDNIKDIQEEVIKPQLKRIVTLLMYSTDVAGGYLDPTSIKWDIKFNPLFTPDDKTQSETFLNYMNALSTGITAGMLDPDEGKQMLQAQNNNQIGQMQTVTDSKEHVPTKAEIKQYKKELTQAKKAVNHGRQT